MLVECFSYEDLESITELGYYCPMYSCNNVSAKGFMKLMYKQLRSGYMFKCPTIVRYGGNIHESILNKAGIPFNVRTALYFRDNVTKAEADSLFRECPDVRYIYIDEFFE